MSAQHVEPEEEFEPKVVRVEGVDEATAERLEELVAASTDQVLHREAILDDAADPDSPLHHHFEWDDTEAARHYRDIQAEALIRRVKVRIEVEPQRTFVARAYVSQVDLPSAKKDIGSYVPITQIPGQTAYEADLRSAMERDIQRLIRKYRNTQELLGEVITDVVAALEETEAEAEGQ